MIIVDNLFDDPMYCYLCRKELTHCWGTMPDLLYRELSNKLRTNKVFALCYFGYCDPCSAAYASNRIDNKWVMRGMVQFFSDGQNSGQWMATFLPAENETIFDYGFAKEKFFSSRRCVARWPGYVSPERFLILRNFD